MRIISESAGGCALGKTRFAIQRLSRIGVERPIVWTSARPSGASIRSHQRSELPVVTRSDVLEHADRDERVVAAVALR